MSTQKETKPVGEVRNFMGQTVIHGPVFNSIPDGTKVYLESGASNDELSAAASAALEMLVIVSVDPSINKPEWMREKLNKVKERLHSILSKIGA